MGQARIRGAERATVDGITFDSRREMRRWCILQLRVKAREVSDLQRQVKIPLIGRDGPLLTPTGRQMLYVADFVYRDIKTGLEVVEDAKGHRTDTYLMKKAVLAAQGVHVVEV